MGSQLLYIERVDDTKLTLTCEGKRSVAYFDSVFSGETEGDDEVLMIAGWLIAGPWLKEGKIGWLLTGTEGHNFHELLANPNHFKWPPEYKILDHVIYIRDISDRSRELLEDMSRSDHYPTGEEYDTFVRWVIRFTDGSDEVHDRVRRLIRMEKDE